MNLKNALLDTEQNAKLDCSLQVGHDALEDSDKQKQKQLRNTWSRRDHS